MIQDRINFELNPIFNPPGDSSDSLAKLQRMVPADKRKLFMLQQLDKYGAMTLVSSAAGGLETHTKRDHNMCHSLATRFRLSTVQELIYPDLNVDLMPSKR